jgi:tetratricopeptide (TPR) repeat protein
MDTRKYSIDRLGQIVTFIIALLVPVFFIPSQAVSVDIAKTFLLVGGVFVALLLYLVNVVKRGEFELPTHRSLWAILLIPAAYFLSSVLSANPRVSLFGYNLEVGTWAFVTLGFVLTYLVISAFKTRERIFYSYLGFLAGFVIIAAIALTKIFFGPGKLALGVFNDPVAGPLGSWTDTAAFFGAAAVLAMVAFDELATLKRGKLVLSIVLLVSLFVLTVLSVSAVWISLAVFSLIYLLYTFSFNQVGGDMSGERKISYPALAIFLVALIFAFNPTVSSSGMRLGDVLGSSFGISNVSVSPSLKSTIDVVRPVVGENPILGSGPNTFDIDWNMHKPAGVNQSIFWNVAFPYGIGYIPTMAATTGFLGIGLWLTFLILFAILGVKMIFHRQADELNHFLVSSSFIVSLFLWVLMFFYVPSKAMFALAFIFTGLFFASLATSGLLVRRTILFRNSARLSFVAVLVLIAILVGNVAYAYSAVRQSVASVYINKASIAAGQENGVEAARKYAAQAASIAGEDTYYGALAQIGIARANTILNTATGTPEQAKADFQAALAETISAAQLATQARPENPQNWITLGLIYESLVPAPFSVQGAYESAKAAYEEAAKRSPQGPEPLYLQARLEVLKNNNAAARDLVQKALEKKNDYADAYYLLTQLEIAENNITGAIKSAETLAILAPNNAGIYFQLGLLKYAAQDYQGAAQALEAALRIVPEYSNAKYYHALAIDKLGMHEEAIKEFEDLQKTNPDNTELPKILENLRAGKDPLAGLGADTAATSKTTPPIPTDKKNP